MEAAETDLAFVAWLDNLHSLTGSPELSTRWREQRFRFAHRLGQALVGASGAQPAVSGAVVYGVWLSWGLLYVGQTLDASRRLRDLPIGESHHLANTFPPEIWDRVVVISWPALPEANAAVDELGVKTVGLALEHRLQLSTAPLANAARRTTSGGWHTIDRSRSASVGARSADAIELLYQHVKLLWDQASGIETGELPECVRRVRPADLLPRSN